MLASLLLMAGLGGCKNDDYPEKTVRTDDVVGNKYSYIFGTHEYFFSTNENNDKVYIINSEAELRDCYKGTAKLPNVSFNSYTVIVGRAMIPYYGYISDQLMTVKDVNATVTLKITATGMGGWPEEKHPVYFWGMYPKQNLNKVGIKKIITNEDNMKDPTETTFMGMTVPLKRAKKSSVPAWLVEKIAALNAFGAYEGKWKGGTVYIIDGYSKYTNYDPDIVFVIMPSGGHDFSIYDKNGNSITIDDIMEVNDLKCIYTN